MAENWDMFAPLEALVLPGHNVDVLKGLLEQLTLELEPDNLIDRMHVRDVAFGTAMAEFLRRVCPAFLAQILEHAARAEGSAAVGKGEPRSSVAPDDLVLAKAFSDNMGAVGQLIELQTKVVEERDRSAAILKEDKLKKMRNALKNLEGMLDAAGCDVEVLDDD